MFAFLLICEGFFRSIGYDFASKQEVLWREYPICFRQPMVPMGETYFRRHGPDRWKGQTLYTATKILNIEPNPYGSEPVIMVKYDKYGFRNPEDIANWDIVVTGDSFVELGHLSDEDLFTTILGKLLGVRVLNLGVSYSSLLSQLSYLRNYGISAGTKHAIVVFFEGNDFAEFDGEYNAFMHWRKTGLREYREFKRETSAVKAFYQLYVKMRIHFSSPRNLVTAYFNSSQGNIPVTVSYVPVKRTELSEERIQQLNYFLGEYASFGKEKQITVWLAFMPAKRRVLDGYLEFTSEAKDEVKSWQPTGLPQLISELSDQNGIKFIDLTPALVEETRNKGKPHLVYNSILDTHINSIGSLVVGKKIARQLSGTMLPRN